VNSSALFAEDAVKDEHMATSTVTTIHGRTSGLQKVSADSMRASARVQRQRRISPESGRALEILGHAIDYLSDEHIYRGGQFSLSDPRVQAVLMLIERNREIYLACPEVPSLGERFRRWLGILGIIEAA
jgi:hypothetical protein